MGGRGILRGWGDDRIGYAWLHKESYAYLPARKISIVRRSLGLGRFRTAYWLYPEPGKSEMLHNLNRRGISWVFVLGTLRSMVRFLATPDAKSAVGTIVSLLAVVDIIAIMRWRGWNLPLEDQLGQDGKISQISICELDGFVFKQVRVVGDFSKSSKGWDRRKEDAISRNDVRNQHPDFETWKERIVLALLGHGKSADTLIFGFGRTETLSEPLARCKTYENSVSLR